MPRPPPSAAGSVPSAGGSSALSGAAPQLKLSTAEIRRQWEESRIRYTDIDRVGQYPGDPKVPERLVLTAYLPEIASISELCLVVSAARVMVFRAATAAEPAGGETLVDIELPFTVDDVAVRARFSSKRRLLSVDTAHEHDAPAHRREDARRDGDGERGGRVRPRREPREAALARAPAQPAISPSSSRTKASMGALDPPASCAGRSIRRSRGAAGSAAWERGNIHMRSAAKSRAACRHCSRAAAPRTGARAMPTASRSHGDGGGRASPPSA
eukprot:gene22211-19262_t